MDFTFGLSKFGPEYVLMGLMATVIGVLYRKLNEAKDQQIEQAKEENERGARVCEILRHSADNLANFIKSDSSKK